MMGSTPLENGKLEEQKPGEEKAFTVYEVDEALLGSKIKKFTWQLKESAGGASCSIFRIPQSLAEVRPQDYKPHILSIGPYHHGQKGLQMIEQHKWRFLDSLLLRTKDSTGKGLSDYVRAMEALEVDARDCYSEIISLDSKKFVQIMLLDSCFVVELLRSYAREIDVEEDDPIFLIPWVLPFLVRDFLRLENQLPFFVIQRVFNLSEVAGDKKRSSLAALALKFFSGGSPRTEKVITRCENLKPGPKHLLDLFRSSFIPPYLKEPKEDNHAAQIIHCVSKLLRAGIEFKTIEAESFLLINFKNELHRLRTVLPALLYVYNNFRHLPRSLIDTEKDVGLLCDEKIIENYFGSDKEVATFFNELGRDVIFDVETCYLAKQFEEVNKYYRNSLHVRWAEFKNTYFSSTWSFISAIAALFLLALTVLQTGFTIYPYFHPR